MQTKRVFFSFLLGLIVFVSLATPLQASACLPGFGWFCDLKDNIVRGIATIIVSAVTVTTGLIFFLVSAVTNWLIVEAVNTTVFPGGTTTPAFVAQGWTFSRNFVNIFFLLILVFIGLATILRLREYELQRTLPRLIVVALLVNFSGLLVGFLADVGNIMTVFFTQNVVGASGSGLGSSVFADIFTTGNQLVAATFDNAGDDLARGFATALAIGAALGFFFIFATIAYLAIAIVFFLRLVILWTLVILAPFAFAFSILPITRKWWNQWLDALIQWSFITVPLAFFMWLASNVLATGAGGLGGQPNVSGTVGSAAPLIGSMLAPFTAIVLLFIGLGMSAGMTGMARSAARFGGRAAAVGVGYVGGRWAYDKLRSRAANSELLRRMETYRAGDSAPKTMRGKIAKFALRTPGVSAAARATARNVRGRAIESRQRDVGASQAKYKGMSMDSIVSKMKGGGLSDTERAGAVSEVVSRRGGLRDARALGLSSREINAAHLYAVQTKNADLQEGLEFGSLRDASSMAAFAENHRKASSHINKGKDQYDKRVGGKRVNRQEEFVDENGKVVTDSKQAMDLPMGVTSEDVDEGFTNYDSEGKPFLDENGKEDKLAAFKRKTVAGATSADDIGKFQRGFQDDEVVKDAMHEFWGGPQISAAGNRFGKSVINALEDSKKSKDWYGKLVQRGLKSDGTPIYRPRNAGAPGYFAGNAAQNLGLTPIDDLQEPKDVKEWARGAREQARKANQDITGLENAIVELQQQLRIATVSRDAERIQQLEAQIRELSDIRAAKRGAGGPGGAPSGGTGYAGTGGSGYAGTGGSGYRPRGGP